MRSRAEAATTSCSPYYEGTLPEGGYLVRHSSTNRVLLLGRAFVDQNEDNQPSPWFIGAHASSGAPLWRRTNAKSAKARDMTCTQSCPWPVGHAAAGGHLLSAQSDH